MEISIKETTCGPQPLIHENLTISVNGFEVTKYSNCYHKGNLVDISGEPYSYIDNEWEKVEQKIFSTNKGFVNKFDYAADNSLETFEHMDASNINVADQGTSVMFPLNSVFPTPNSKNV